MTTDELREQPAVQGLVQVAHNALDRINALEHEVSVLKTALFQAQEAAKQLAKQPVQEPVAWIERVGGGVSYDVYHNVARELPEGFKSDLYTTPPRREWVGLTDDDLKPVCDEYRILFGGWAHDFARAIEAKLREKNA